MHDLSKFRLGRSPDEILAIETRQETVNAALELTKQSTHKLTIFSKDLEPCVYNQPDFLEALKNLALIGHHVQIRILVSNIESIISAGHGLLNYVKFHWNIKTSTKQFLLQMKLVISIVKMLTTMRVILILIADRNVKTG
jgi:hypothetical protein